jgi:O-antigen ligase
VALWTAQFACFAAIAIAVVGWQDLRDRLGAPGTEELRVDAVRASLAMIHDRPWMGSGLGTWTRMYPRYASLDTGQTVNQAHNDWAQWAAEGGLPFLLVMILFAGLPNVAFQFEGREGAEGGVLPCSGPGGLQGEAALRLPANGNRLGEELLLISGAATLVRKLE